MTELPVERPAVAAVLAALVAGLGADRAGYARKPADGGQKPDGKFHGYAVVYGTSTVPIAGTAAAPNADGAQTLQVTYVGRTPEQADDVRDAGRAAVLAPGAVAVAGRALMNPVSLVDSTQAREDSSVQPPLWFAVDRYRLDTTPE